MKPRCLKCGYVVPEKVGFCGKCGHAQRLSPFTTLFVGKGNVLKVCDARTHDQLGTIELDALQRHLIATDFTEIV